MMVPLSKEGKHKELIVYKKAYPAYDFINLPMYHRHMYDIEDYKFVIGHNRHATRGDLVDHNAHPFHVGNITLVHNGHITNTYELDVPDFSKIDVDSEIIAQAIALHGYKKVLPKLKGAAALVWYDEEQDCLNLYRNSERPLHFAPVKADQICFVASEPEMLEWLAFRNGFSLKKVYSVAANTIVTFKNDVHKFTVEEIKIEKPKPIISQVTVSSIRTPYAASSIIDPNKGKTTSEILKEMGLELNKPIEFMFEEMQFNSHKSRHGTLKGRALHKPYPDIRAQGIERTKFKGDYVLKGIVTNVEYDPRYRVTEVVVRDVEVTNKPDPAFSNDHHRALDDDEDIPGWDDSNVPAIEKEGNITYVPGPRGVMITLETYRDITKHGCAHCTGPVLEKEASLLAWTKDSQPLCPECQGNPELLNHIAETGGYVKNKPSTNLN